jgi:DNA-binding IclR family transcriptional regulator
VAVDDGAAPQSQTLDRGVRILEHLATAGTAQPISEIGQALGLHRSIAYRLLRTLEDHQLVERDTVGHYRLGLGLAGLARGVRADLQTACAAATDRPGGRARHDGLPRRARGKRRGDHRQRGAARHAAHVVYRPGTRHPVGRGAPGLALLMPEPPSVDDRNALRAARRTGWASSHGEVIPGLRSVAVPVLGPDGGGRAALAVVFVDESADVARLGRALASASEKVAAGLR